MRSKKMDVIPVDGWGEHEREKRKENLLAVGDIALTVFLFGCLNNKCVCHGWRWDKGG